MALYIFFCLISAQILKDLVIPYKCQRFFFFVSNSDVPHLKKELDDLVDAIIENFFEPDKNKLQPKPQ